jgi:protein O-mannosyl-transferase
MAKRRGAAVKKEKLVEQAPAAGVPDSALWMLMWLATFIAYRPALNGGFVWDDDGHITKPALQSLHGLWRIWFDLGATQQYYPLLHSLFWLEHQVWGDAGVGYHVINVALHAAAASLVVAIVRRLELPGAWLAGFAFALHPVCVESVAWISEQKNTLSAVFALAAVLIYLRFDATRARRDYVLATVLFVLALLSKTVAAATPGALLVILWWKRGKLDWKRDVIPLLPWFAFGAAGGLFTAWVERVFIGAHGSDFALTPVERVLIAGRALWFYVGKLIWPSNLIFSYPRWQIDAKDWVQFLFPAAWIAAGILLWRLAPRYRGPLAAFLIFTGMLFPVLGFLNVYPFRYSFVADHFQYLASLALIIPASSAIVTLLDRAPRWASLAPVALLFVFAILTAHQSAKYLDAETLYRDTLEKNPASWMAHNSLGNILVQNGRINDAITQYDAALRLRGDIPEPHVSRGLALARSHPPRYEEAIAEYQAGLRMNPDWAEAHVNLGNALGHMGRYPEAIVEYRTALRLKPHLPEAHNSLANALANTGHLQDATAEYRAALDIDPNYIEAHVNLGTTLAQMPGRRAEAMAEYQAALDIRPDLTQVQDALQQLQGADSDGTSRH